MSVIREILKRGADGIPDMPDGGVDGMDGISAATTFKLPPLTPYQKKIIAHAALMGVAYLIIIPIGAIVGRYRIINPFWFKIHFFLQLFVAGPLIIAGFALGVNMTNFSETGNFNDPHKKAGLALFVMYWCQAILGLVVHYVKPSRPVHRPPQNYVHAILGLSIVGLALYQVREGYKVEWVLYSGRGEVPNGVNIVWYIWVVLLPVLYIIGLVFLRRQYRDEKAKRDEHRNKVDMAER